MQVRRLSMVYDADGGLRGELAYVWGRFRGAHCGLCDITHGRVREKQEFTDLVASLEVAVEVLHRNEQDPDLAAFTEGALPVVVAHTDSGAEVVMDRHDLDSCHGDVAEFGARLRSRLESLRARS